MGNKPAIAIIQARMSSRRLPGKVMLPLAGKPVIHHIVDRAKSCKNVGEVIVATSNEKSDDELADYCVQNEIKYYRGSLNNVLSRFVNILKLYDYDYCVRITGDCPLIHPLFIDAQIDALEKLNGDLLWLKKQSSVLEGQGVISKRAIFHVYNNSNDSDDLEHVGSKYFLLKPKEFRFIELIIPEKYYTYNYRITLDEKSDYEFLEYIFKQNWSSNLVQLDEVLKWLKSIGESQIKNRHIQPSLINIKLNDKRLTFDPEIVGSYPWGNV